MKYCLFFNETRHSVNLTLNNPKSLLLKLLDFQNKIIKSLEQKECYSGWPYFVIFNEYQVLSNPLNST